MPIGTRPGSSGCSIRTCCWRSTSIRKCASRSPRAGQGDLQQAGYTPVLVKVINDSTATKALRISSPQAGPPYAGMARLSMTRQDQLHLLTDPKYRPDKDRFLHVEMFTSQPMTANLSGLKVEYAIALIYSSEAGKREATIGFDVGQGTQDLGFRAETPVLFDVRPAVPVKLAIPDHDGQPTVGRFTFRDQAGHVHPPQARRLAPDLFFQEQIYRNDGDIVLLPPGEFTMYYSRGPGVSPAQEDDHGAAQGRGARRRASWSAGSTRRRTASTAAITTSTRPAAPTTPARPKA